MADPLSIIGGTAAIIDLAKCVWKILDTAKTLYDADDQNSAETLRMETVSKEMEETLHRMSAIDTKYRQKYPEIAPLVDECRKVGEDILKILEKIRPQQQGKVWQAVKGSVRLLLKREQLEKLLRDQNSIKTQLIAALQSVMMYACQFLDRSSLTTWQDGAWHSIG